MTDSANDDPQDPAQKSLGDILTNLPAVRAAKKVNTMSRVHRRIIEAEQDEEPSLAFQHTVFCQTALPYRDPGNDVRLWKRSQGSTFLEVQAGRVFDPSMNDTVEVGAEARFKAAADGQALEMMGSLIGSRRHRELQASQRTPRGS